MKKKIAMLLSSLLVVSMLSGCGSEATVNTESNVTTTTENQNTQTTEPVNITVWTYYNGSQLEAFNSMVEEFNRTVGQEQGIRVRVDSVSNTNTIHESVLAAAYGDPSASELPDLFISYG